MKLTPLDIKKQEFKKVLRGYDVMEVETFLEMVADEYESLFKSKNESVSKVKAIEEKLKEYQEIEKTLQKTLLDAQKSLSKSKEDSKKEAELIIKEAEITANKIIEDSRIESARLKNEIMILKAQKESLAIRLKHILNSQIELIKILEMDDFEVEKFKKGDKKDTEVLKETVKGQEKQYIQKPPFEEVSKKDKESEKLQKKETLKEENSPFGVVGSKGKVKSDIEQNLIEKMVLEIDEEEFKDNKTKKDVLKKNINNNSIQENKNV